MSQIVVTKEVGLNVFDSSAQEWRELFAKSDATPFSSHEWISTWHKFFGANKTPYILKAHRDGELIALMPLYQQVKSFCGIGFTKFGFLGDEIGGADYLDVIAENGDKATVLKSFFDYLERDKTFDLLNLENLSADSLIIIKASENQSKSLNINISKGEICPQVNLSEKWNGVLSQSRRKDNFKRRLKQLEKMPDFEFRSVTAPEEIEAAFERFYFLHEKRWKGEGGSEATGHPKLKQFHREAVAKLAHAKLIRFDEVWAANDCRSSVYGLNRKNVFYYYNAGYDLEWARYSVGLVLVGLSIKSAIERGDGLYDFLRGDESYKFDWSNQQNSLANFTLKRQTFSLFLHDNLKQTKANARDLSKKVLPSKIIKKLQNWKRQRSRKQKLDDTSENQPAEYLST
ncbi:MAG: GNAT family N-acetyltransferase [Pyrinomonadaceae bacterium]|nr:GNAT family N-acetyltransferase [Pyrinomonadaceae bacterium]